MTISRGRGGQLVNSVTENCPDRSQLSTYDEVEFLRKLVYSLGFAPAKNLEF